MPVAAKTKSPDPPDIAETGEVDVSLVEWMLSLTPSQRLAHLESFANFILSARLVGDSNAPVRPALKTID